MGGVGGSMVMEVKLLQPKKQLSPKLVMDLGMVMDVKPLQPEKHSYPKLVIVADSGMVMEVKLLHLQNVLLVDYQYYTL